MQEILKWNLGIPKVLSFYDFFLQKLCKNLISDPNQQKQIRFILVQNQM